MQQTPLERRGPPAGQLHGWRVALELAQRERDRLVESVGEPCGARAVADKSLEIARRGAAIGDAARLLEALQSAARWAAAAVLCELAEDGRVDVRVGDALYALPWRARGCVLPPDWANAVAAAVIVRDDRAIEILTGMDAAARAARTAAVEIAPVGAEAFWAPLCLVLAATVRGEPQPAASFEAARDALRHTESSAIDPRSLRADQEPLLDLLEALSLARVDDWPSLVEATLERFDTLYAAPDLVQLDTAMLPLGLVAALVLAHDRFQLPPIASPFVPEWLVRGEFAPADSAFACTFGRRTARNATEIHWFFDLSGVPRDSREHSLREADGELIAAYRLRGWRGVQSTSAEFVVQTDARALLDAGELLLVSDLHAHQVSDRPPVDSSGHADWRFHLTEALAALDEVLALVESGADRVPDAAFWSPRGRAVLEEAPGRFDVDRLQAVRQTYADLLGLGAAAAEASARLSMEAIVAAVRPILAALANDRSGDIARQLRPRREDYARVFVGDAVAVARNAYEQQWSAPSRLQVPESGQSELLCYVAPAGMLAEDNEVSRPFPGGYRAIAGWLNPRRAWVRWKYVRPGQTIGLAYDGLVWCDDHWAWFPRPYRALAALADAPPGG